MPSIPNIVASLQESKETVQGVQRDLLPVILWKMEKEGALGCTDAAEMLREAVFDLAEVVENMTGETVFEKNKTLPTLLSEMGNGHSGGWVAVTIESPNLVLRREEKLSSLAGWLENMDEKTRDSLVIFKA